MRNPKLLLSRSLIACFFFGMIFPALIYSQPVKPGKYPSLLWEISGNGLKHPSYLFGTMHVSSKMAFHLSDSFYTAIRSVDAVALELNPEDWQGQLVRMESIKNGQNSYLSNWNTGYITETSFRIDPYTEAIKYALSAEPTVVNGLLYRNYSAKQDFEEDTFLDLYIYQTGKKLGKRATGVENYFESEKIVLEAYADMSSEKKKKEIDTDGESMYSIREKIEQAYKNGDLDQMDSLDNLIERSPAFREKFLLKRNEIQAASIDTILKKSSLFVGVGAAHLPGPRGVIEALRKMGYHLRPIRMNNRDARQKELIDKLKVPVQFKPYTAEDGFFKVMVPGTLYHIGDDAEDANRLQYADMANGSYYLIYRINTLAGILGDSPKAVLKKTDSLLYENIPGKILSRKSRIINGYPALEIINKTRRGDMQQYLIIAAANEVILFKLSGKDNYIQGAESQKFFNSVWIRPESYQSQNWTPAFGGFTVQLPSAPAASLIQSANNQLIQWQIAASDSSGNNACLIIRKPVYQYFLEEDSFNLNLIQQSFLSSKMMEPPKSKFYQTDQNRLCLNVTTQTNDSAWIFSRSFRKGAAHYLLAVRSKDSNAVFARHFFESFRFSPFPKLNNTYFTDSFLHFGVTTCYTPSIDTNYRNTLERLRKNVELKQHKSNDYWPRELEARLGNDSTGENIDISVKEYPLYYYAKDTARFWPQMMEDLYDTSDLILKQRTYFEQPNGTKGYRLILRDTGSSSEIWHLFAFHHQFRFHLTTTVDTLEGAGAFTENVFQSFTGISATEERNLFTNRLDTFFSDLFSKDSILHERAANATPYVYFGEKGIPRILQALHVLNRNAPDYFDLKEKLITELGYIIDSTHPVITSHLRKLYEQSSDTAAFQHKIIEALARHGSRESFLYLKELMLQDPPVYEDNDDYSALFQLISDSLPKAALLYPELLQLAGIEDYKNEVMQLLTNLVDSNLIRGPQYADYFNRIYFDAKITLRKQAAADEHLLSKQKDPDEEDKPEKNYENSDYRQELERFASLLIPFYDSHNVVPRFFDKLLQSANPNVRLTALACLLKHNRPVPDTLIAYFASRDLFRAGLYEKLEVMKKTSLMPPEWNTQELMARSLLVRDENYLQMDSMVLIGSEQVSYRGEPGTVYFFKYRVQKKDDWKIGISGLQPVRQNQTRVDSRLVTMSDKKIKSGTPEIEQFEKLLEKMLIEAHTGGRRFYKGSGFDLSRFSNGR